jgi:hypothetical protein
LVTLSNKNNERILPLYYWSFKQILSFLLDEFDIGFVNINAYQVLRLLLPRFSLWNLGKRRTDKEYHVFLLSYDLAPPSPPVLDKTGTHKEKRQRVREGGEPLSMSEVTGGGGGGLEPNKTTTKTAWTYCNIFNVFPGKYVLASIYLRALRFR